MTRPCPIGSNLRAVAARDSGTNSAVSRMAASAIGMFTQNTDRQPTVWVRAPPTSGPSAIDTPTTAPHTPTARARSRGTVNVLVMIDIATGFSIDPPRPWTTRANTRNPMLGATLQSNDPRPKTTRPIWKTRRRPNLSAVAPESSRKLAIVSV